MNEPRTVSRPRVLALTILLALPPTLALPPVPAEIDWEAAGDEVVELFRTYLSINTSNPPGDVSRAAVLFERALQQAGVPVELIWTDRPSGKVNVLARLRGNGSKRPLLLLNHIDTVPVERDQWSVDPFGGIVKDGYVWGRGALDMKNFGVVQLMTMILLGRAQVELERDVIFLAVPDEELGGATGARWIAENRWDEIDAEYVLDEGGFGTRGFFTDDDRMIVTVGVAEKKGLTLRLSVTGTEGHASMPPLENANFILARALARVAEYQESTRLIPTVQTLVEQLGTLADTPYVRSMTRSACSLTVMRGQVGDPPKTNVIPTRAEAVLDCRLLPDQDQEGFAQRMIKVIGDSRVRVEYRVSDRQGLVSEPESELVDVIRKEVKAVYPGAVVLPHLIIYATDSRYFREKGAQCYGFFPGLVTMEDYERVHGNDERVREESLRKALQVFYRVVATFAAAPSSAARR